MKKKSINQIKNITYKKGYKITTNAKSMLTAVVNCQKPLDSINVPTVWIEDDVNTIREYVQSFGGIYLDRKQAESIVNNAPLLSKLSETNGNSDKIKEVLGYSN